MTSGLVALTETHRDFVDHLVAQGRFPTAEAVVAQAIEFLPEDEMEWQAFLDRIHKAYDEAMAAPSAAGTDREASAVRLAFRQSRQSYAARMQDDRRDDGAEEAE